MSKLFISAGNKYTTYETRWKEIPKSLRELGAKVIRMTLENGDVVDAICLPKSCEITEGKVSRIKMPRRGVFARVMDWFVGCGNGLKQWTWRYSFKGRVTLVSWKLGFERKFRWELDSDIFSSVGSGDWG